MSKWCSTAPHCLIELCEDRKIVKGRDILEHLLCDDELTGTWIYLKRIVQNEKIWLSVWGDISYAKFKSNQIARSVERGTRLRRTDEREIYDNVATSAAELARQIGTVNNPLDVLIYRLFPSDVLSILGIKNSNDIDLQAIDDRAHELLTSWPSTSELLNGLAGYAQQLADHAMEKDRPDERKSGSVKERTFVWYLGLAFKRRFGQSMYGIVANIAAATFKNESSITITKSFVQSVLKKGV